MHTTVSHLSGTRRPPGVERALPRSFDDGSTSAVLEQTLSTTFVPGTNVKGQVGGANWIFLRRRIRADRCLCVGVAPLSTLTTLAGVSGSLTVAVRWTRTARAIERACRHEGLTNVQVLVIGPRGMLALPTASIDLAAIIGWRSRWQLRRNRCLASEVARLLRPDAEIYYEHPAADPLEREPLLMKQQGGQLSARRFWLTPLTGQMHTAVPMTDGATIEEFRRKGLYSPTVSVYGVTRFLKRASSLLGLPPRQPAGAASKKFPTTSPNGGAAGSGRSRLRARLGGRFRPWIVWISHLLDRQPLIDRWMGRRGVLATRPEHASDAPPEYLRAIAAPSGVRLEQFRWGLAARGEYSSRKVLFLLKGQDGARGTPSYIAKLVRSPHFNLRLENEHRALRLLEELGVGESGAVPRPVFFGYHAGLAVLGETVLDGEPFRQRTTRAPDCPGLHGALDFLYELAVRTSSRAIPPGPTAAQALATLFARLASLYRISPDEQRFLETRIAALGTLEASLPLVLQHGDPGPWNMLVRAGGRVALLDWEAAERAGLPLWDHFYFLRAFCIDAACAGGPRDPLAGFLSHFMGATPLGTAVVEATKRYCAELGVPRDAVEPLFYTCWMHRALKEATRLERTALESGHYINLLRLTIAKRGSPVLQRLFGA